MKKIVLASASPRRRELIKMINNISVRIVPSDITEELSSTCSPCDNVKNLATQKAKDIVAKKLSNASEIVLGCDTIVVCGDKILSKPSSDKEAMQMFELLSDSTHSVLTGLCLICGDQVVQAVEETLITFKPIDKQIVKKYISDGHSSDKAGAYGIQDKPIASMVKTIVGEKENVIGLPIKRLEALLKENF